MLGIEKNFIWLDWLDDIEPLMAAADLFVSPSHSESFGLAMLDAMVAGVPVIATETVGARQLITDLRALVRIKEPFGLAERIKEYLADATAREKLGSQQEKNSREMFSLPKMVDATEAVYLEVLRSR